MWQPKVKRKIISTLSTVPYENYKQQITIS